ncbi:MAG: hypothetical protein AUH92_02955 [Acidobacteria bacterium 13_1_40CM_4_69_4]|nr:MAG: hypothetical protein AUH92_02955 [Acidobacteria bacterium 13_1_40CM_4_69_4]
MTLLTFALNHAAGGVQPFGYRLVNLLLHVLNTVLVFLLAGRLVVPTAPGMPRAPRPIDPSLLAGLLFAVHPAHTEALGEVVGRAELLAAGCALGSVLAFLRGRENARHRAGIAPGPAAGAWPWYSLSLVLFVIGSLAKENAVVIPALVLLADLLLSGRRPAYAFHVAAVAALGAVLWLRHAVLGGVGAAARVPFVDNPIVQWPFLQGRLTALKVLVKYALLMVWPARMSIDYSFAAIPPARGLLDPGALAGGALVLAWGAAALWSRKRFPGGAFALAWIGIALTPVANLLFPIGTIMAERLLYLPSVGFCVAAAAAIAWGIGRLGRAGGRARAAALLAVGVALVALASRTVVRLRDWRDDYTIFRAALRVAPDSVRVLFNYASACEERGDDATAIHAYVKALDLWGDFADAHYNLAGVLTRQKRWDEAAGQYREAVRLEPGNVQYLVNLAHSLIGRGRDQEARDLLRRALDIDPRSAVGYTNLGAIELAHGDVQAALRAYAEAVRLEPGNADYQRNLGVAQHEAGDRRAAESFRRALAIRPADPDLLDGLGLALLDAGDPGGARQALGQAVAARPGHPVYRYHLARALERSDDLPEAAAQYREAIRLAPAVAIPYRGLGLLLERMGDHDGALTALERASGLDPAGTVMDDRARALLASLRRRARTR